MYETSAKGNALTRIDSFEPTLAQPLTIHLDPTAQFQKITGFGGSFTEAAASVLHGLSPANQEAVIEAYFGEEGAQYSLTRTHIASCDFSRQNYTYAPIAGDLQLNHFSIEPDRADLLPMIKAAQKRSKEGFKIIASPWSCPPWMKDNKSFVGGKLLPEFQSVFALYFSKYLEAYRQEGIPIWGVTVINEPHGNGNNWESTLFSPEEMTEFVQHHLGPHLEQVGWGAVRILGYDQNRAGLPEWVDAMYRNESTSNYFAGTAIHWYESTFDYFPDALQYAHHKAPEKYLIETEGCIDAEVPHWKEDAWYWSKEATDWGWDWASPQEKYLHPKYAPAHRYANDIIGCLNNWVDGWIDWNMVLDRQGGPNWFKNWCVAPIIADPSTDEIYKTPLYYIMAHFSKFMRPGAVKIGCTINSKDIVSTAVQNPDRSIAVAIFNPTTTKQTITIHLHNKSAQISIDSEALQTVIIKPN
ncbi:MAG: hypothetical protein RLZZ500_794 [Bacteroidota bacterium]